MNERLSDTAVVVTGGVLLGLVSGFATFMALAISARPGFDAFVPRVRSVLLRAAIGGMAVSALMLTLVFASDASDNVLAVVGSVAAIAATAAVSIAVPSSRGAARVGSALLALLVVVGVAMLLFIAVTLVYVAFEGFR
jgi:hypothetical protein